MAEVVAGLLTSAVVKIAADKLSSAIARQANLAWNFSGDLSDMKEKMESMGALFKDAEKQSVKKESETTRLWLKRLKYAAFDISDMMDDYQDTGTASTAKIPGMLSCFTAARKKMVLANKMRNMRDELRKINEEEQTFNFTRRTTASQDQQHYDERETTSVVNETRILGRDAEKKEILDILSSSSHMKDGTMVLPIYGLGGMGKSTLAQLVYNDNQLKYEHRVWVYVSEVFNLKEIGKSIISQLSRDGGHQNLNSLELITQSLKDLLPNNKKILIVLDDLWQEEASELEKLKTMLHVNKNVSMVDVLVTTRSESIANKICTNEAYKLKALADNVCWDIIKIHSGFEDKSNKQKLEEIGLDIAKKCGGVALAAQALGYMLKEEDDVNGWSRMSRNDIWNESFGGDENLSHERVLPSLKLSFERMIPILRLCFSYCAIFPKGHDIYEDDLVHQWIALDFIKEPSDGKKYIKKLLGMSFLQHSKLPAISGKNVERYTMHDLVHDLARSVLGDELIIIDGTKKVDIYQQKYCRYALLINYDGKTKLSDILPKKVRALHFSSTSTLGPRDGSFSFVKRLCILDFSQCSGIILPSSIGQLKQLKCLIAPELQNKCLPDAIGELSKLQYLNLRRSSLISALPEQIGKLSCLTYLGLSGCSGIFNLPEPFGGLISLVNLDMSNCYQITALPDSLGNLAKLQHLDLSECRVLKKLPESLGGLKQLHNLNLSKCESITRLPEDIGSLNNLQYFALTFNQKIREVPGSFKNLQNLVHLDLTRCCCEIGLPEALSGLTSLEHLNIMDLPFNELLLKDLSDAIGNLTSLKYLNIADVFSVRKFTSVDFIGTLTNLEHLDLSANKGIVSLPNNIGKLKKLHTLDLSHCSNLKFLPDSISEITGLKSLLTHECSDQLIEQAYSKLHYSLTLPWFKVIQADNVSPCSNLPLLEGTNVGELRIQSLENVRSLEEACKVKLLDKDKRSDLTLEWTIYKDEMIKHDFHRFVNDKDLLGQLVPPRGLKSLGLYSYSDPSFPSWFMDISFHLPNLVKIELAHLHKCNNLPPLGQLPNLQKLVIRDCDRVTKIDKDFCGGKGAFRRLSEFKLTRMGGLKEWCTTYSFEDCMEFMFPVLDKLAVEACPRLMMTPCPPVCREFTIHYCDGIISSLENLGKNIGHPTSSTPTTILRIRCSDRQSLSRLFQHFTALQVLEFYRCYNLTDFPEDMQHLTSLQSLHLDECECILALPEWLGDLTSLKSLTIGHCPGVESFPPSIRQLTSLQKLVIRKIPELKRWCESEENKMKLAHINEIRYVRCESTECSSEEDELTE